MGSARPTLYDVLGTRPDASPAELRRAFLEAARRHHPDFYTTADRGTRVAAEQRMRELNEAWAVLGDELRRRDYDRSLRAANPGGGTGTAARPGARPAGAAPGAPRPASSGPRVASERVRDWRSYASPGPGGARHRPMLEQVVTLSPVLFLGTAGFFGAAGALIGWPPFFALAMVAVLFAATAFFMVPIWTMTRANHARRSRAYRRPAARPRAGRPPGRGGPGPGGAGRPPTSRRPGPPQGGPTRPTR